MEPVSKVDHLALVLSQRLKERGRAPEARNQSSDAQAAPLDAVQALAALEDVDDRKLKRALVERLLSHTFGSELINDAAFQQVVERVVETLDRDPDLGGLMAKVVTSLRSGARS